MSGYIYLLHFDQPICPTRTTQHYLGYTRCLPARIQAHRLGFAARLTQVAKERGISFEVARVWRGSRAEERRLKRRKKAHDLCPFCHQRVQPGLAAGLSQEEIEEALLPF